MTQRFFVRLSRLAALPVVSAILAACGLGAPPEPTPVPTPSEPRELKVYMLESPALSQVLDILIKGFQERNPGYTVKTVNIQGNPPQELASLAAAGQQPDIIWTIDTMTQAMVAGGVLLDMREFARADSSFNLDDIDPNVLAIGNGKTADEPGLYMIPASLETIQMFYNKSMFEAAGAPLPQPDWTWNDLIDACQLIQASQNGVNCLSFFNAGMPGPDWWAYWAPFVRGYGGDLLTADGQKSTLSSPESLAGLQAYVNLWTESKVARGLNARGGDCFVEQRCAVVFFASLGIKSFRDEIGGKFDWDVQIMPEQPQGRFTGAAVYGFGIGKSSKHPEAAWDFVKYLATPEAQRLLVTQRLGMPVLKSMAGDASLTQLPPPPENMQAFIEGAKIGIPPSSYPIQCGSLYVGLVQETIAQALRSVLGGADVEQAFKTADARIQACLDANK